MFRASRNVDLSLEGGLGPTTHARSANMPTSPMEYIWPGIVAAQAIHAAAKLRIAELLASGPRSASALAAEAGADASALERLLRALSTFGIFSLTPDGSFANTPLSEQLSSGHPQSQRDAALFLPAAFLWRPVGELYESVRTGEPAFPLIFGKPFFEYLAANPQDAAVFNAAMTQGIAYTSPALLAAYDFSRFRCVVDVGGGEGALLREILSATPGLEGILFDMPQAVAQAGGVLTDNIAPRCRIVGGSFFESVPAGGDLYILKGVIHDWPDEDAVKILRTTRRAIGPAGTLLLIENVVDSADRPVGVMELLMLVIGGRERSTADFRTILAAAGFEIVRTIPAGWSTLIECRPV